MTAKVEHEMTAQELNAKYDDLNTGDGWSEHPNFLHSDWAYEASELNTLQGYWEWVASQIEQANEDVKRGIVPPNDPAVKVRQVGGPEGEIDWFISQNLTDRWGDINFHNQENKPLGPLLSDENLLERLRSQMIGEETFIVRKDGQYGVLFEVEFVSIESEDDLTLEPHDVVVSKLMRLMENLKGTFPDVLFAVPDKSQICNERPAVWAFLADGQMDDERRKAFANAWYGFSEEE